MLVLVLVLAAAIVPRQATAPTVKAPDTPAGRALAEFVQSFNAGGDTRRTWVETRTTVKEEPRANILKMDAELLREHGPMTVARIVNSSEAQVVAIVRHARTGAHGHLTIDVETAAPHKVVDLGMRGATPEEVKGGAGR
jgi:hypothetical protein